MIDLLLNIRKPDVRGIWDILGSKWKRAAYNKQNVAPIESLWSINDILTGGRINSLVNIYQKQVQLTNFFLLDFLIFEGKNFKKNKTTFSNEIKIFYKDINLYPNSNVKEFIVPAVITNQLNGAEFLTPLISDNIYSVDEKQKVISLIRGGEIENIKDFNYKNYIFIDSKNVPFIIKNISFNKIYYDTILTNTKPAIGNLKIVDKFELYLNEDFIYKKYKDFIKISFKDFYYIENNVVNNFFNTENNLYAVNVPCADTFEREHFFKPLGLTETDYENLKNEDNSWFDVQDKIYKIWKISQRIFNFEQIYRISSILADEDIVKSITDTEIIYEIDPADRKIKTGKYKKLLYGLVLSNENLPPNLKDEESLENNFPNIIGLTNGNNTFGLSFGDIVVIGNYYYKVTKILSDKYFKVDKEIINNNYITEIKLLPKDSLRVYEPNEYGLNEFFDEASNKHNKTLISVVKFNPSLIWGNFKWNEFLSEINSSTNFSKPYVGKELLYGDTFSKIINVDYAERNINPYFAQKQLAIKNREFVQENVDEILSRKTLVLDHFLNYSDVEKIEENVIESDIWQNDANVSYFKKSFSSYSLTYTNVKMPVNNERLYLEITPENSNLFRFFIRKKSGKLKAGIVNISEEALSFSFNNCNYFWNTEIMEDNIWYPMNIFFTDKGLKNYILFENELKDTEFDIFGMQVFKNIPSFIQKLNKNKAILEKLIFQYDIETINLL